MPISSDGQIRRPAQWAKAAAWALLLVAAFLGIAPSGRAQISEPPVSETLHDDLRELALATRGETIEPIVERMSDSQRMSLLRNMKRLQALPPQQQQALRELHASLTSDPRASQLYDTLVRYHAWLKALPTGVRAELLDLEPQARIERIREIKQRQSIQRRDGSANVLTANDVKAVRRFLEAYLRKHGDAIEAELPVAVRRMMGRSSNPRFRSMTLLGFLARGNVENLPSPSSEEIERFERALSEQALAVWRHTEDHQELLQRWARMVARSRMSEIASEDLEQFYLHQLDATQRDMLDQLPPEEMQRQLRRLFFRSRFDPPLDSEFPRTPRRWRP